MEPGSDEWLAQVAEPVVDPDRSIVDPHHHLWPAGGAYPYGPAELVGDTMSGHRVVATMFVECGAAHRESGPEHFRPVGETEFVVASAERMIQMYPQAPPIAGIVSRADLRLGPKLDEVLDAHEAAGGGLFRGIRHALAHALEPEAHRIPGRAAAGLAADEHFRAGVRRLGARDLTFDSWHFHYQNREFAELAIAVPDTQIVLDHFGTPLGIGQWAGRRAEVFEQWKASISEVAACDNVAVKIGGLAMPDNGFGWDAADRPPTSDEFVEAQAPYYHHAIEAFGPQRCMFESNFPVDRLSVGYRVMWNGLQKIAAEYSESEQNQLFSGTARHVYRL